MRVILAVSFLAFLLQTSVPPDEELARHRNLGKAFYENPTTQKECVDEFAKALKLAPNSAREQLNYALALLRAGRTPEAITLLEKVQKSDPKLPHTWFNLGITYKKNGEPEKAIAQFEHMIKLVPTEPISHYNLGALYKMVNRNEDATREFLEAARLDQNLAAPHFQLYNAYRIGGKAEEAKRELDVFQRLKKQQEGSQEDVEWSEWAEILDIMQDKPAADRPAAVKFASHAVAGAAQGVRFIDATGTGKPVLLIWSAEGIRLEPGGVISSLKGIRSVIPGDFNNDGLDDLCVLTDSGVELLVNQKGKFVPQAAALPKEPFAAAVWIDYDHDHDLDLVLLGKNTYLYRNQGAAGFADHTGDMPFLKQEALDGVAFRLVPDTKGLDLVVSYRDHAVVLYRDKLAGKFVAEDFAAPAGATHLTAADLNNDGSFDVVYSTGRDVRWTRNHAGHLTEGGTIATAGGSFAFADLENRGILDLIAGGKTYRNSGAGAFTASQVSMPNCSDADVTDSNADGRADVACVAGGSASLLINETASPNAWIRVRLQGVKNLKLGPYSEIEIKAGARYQKQMYRGLPLSIGTNGEKTVDTVRITWPNGLIQNEVKQATGKAYSYQEAQRLSGSCPMIWTWNGSQFEYITDVLGVAPLGASSGDGQYFPVDHDEYIQIPGRALKAVNGKYEVRISEELSEVSYLDQVKLIAVDHPASVSIYTNDKFKSPPFPEFRLYGVGKPVRPMSARDDAGRDVLSKLLVKDRVYPDTFARDLNGVAKAHTLTLDFGRGVARDNRAVLILSGWVDWADGSTFLSAAQESKDGLVMPYLQVRDAHGQWKTVIEDMGMPAGKPKTIAVDLTGKFLSDSREVRIVTNLCVYWDEIFLGENPSQPPSVLTGARAVSADLHFRGFSPVEIDAQRKQPEQFFYSNAKATSPWNPTPGLYTRYGDVSELTASIDDRFVVMGSGDELRLLFDAAALPVLKPDWSRDFLLLVDGWAKDRDANTAFSQTVTPYPFHGMSRYPYPANEHYPDDAAHREYIEKYNTRPALRLIRPLAQTAKSAAK